MKSWRLILIAAMLCFLVSGRPLPARAEAMQLNEANNNQAVAVDLGKTLEVSLPSNHTTGFSWSIAGSPDPNVLVKTSNDYIPNAATPQVVGSGGIEHWVFQAIGSGNTQLSLVYSRSWESVQPAKTYSLKIKVNAAPVPGPSNMNHVSFVVGGNAYLINGQTYQMDATPFVAGNRAYVPVRYLVQAFGLDTANISWNASTQTVVLPPNQKGTVYRLQIGNKNIYQVDSGGSASVVKTMDVAPVIRDGRVFLPARYIAELFGYQAQWDAAGRNVLIEPGVN